MLDIKSDGTPRFCTDFRKVNAVTVADAHPLPLIDDCIDEIGPAAYVTLIYINWYSHKRFVCVFWVGGVTCTDKGGQ